MMSEPFFSIVIPTYNRAESIMVTLDSVFGQTLGNFEVIVVDDGSTDNTEEVLKSIQDKRFKYTKISNSERGAARNAGIDLSKGIYVTFLDSDDVFFSDHLAVAYSGLVEHKNPEVYHQAYGVQENGVVTEKWTSPGKNDINTALLTIGNVMSCMGVFVRRDVLRELKFNEDRDLSGFEDWDLWIRLAARYPIVYNARITSALVQHANRSVANIPIGMMRVKVDRLLQSTFCDDIVRIKFGKFQSRFSALVLSYASLHLSSSDEHGAKSVALDFLRRAVWRYPMQLFTQRTVIIIRNLLFR